MATCFFIITRSKNYLLYLVDIWGLTKGLDDNSYRKTSCK